jgi:hypothetical protein
MKPGEHNAQQGLEVSDNLTHGLAINVDAVFEALVLIFGNELEDLLDATSDDYVPEGEHGSAS